MSPNNCPITDHYALLDNTIGRNPHIMTYMRNLIRNTFIT